MSKLTSENILGYQVANVSKDSCVEEILGWIRGNQKGKYFVCANPHSIEVARADPEFHQALRAADLVTPDGIGVVLASRIFGGSIRERVTGSDIFLELSKALNREGGCSYFFLGSTEETLRAIRGRVKSDFPNISVVGTYSPPFSPEFSPEENQSAVEAINRMRPEVLWVGMTAPKQEKWIFRHRQQLDVKFIGAIGAVFDYYAGRVKRSHPAFQRVGLEWLPRFLKEPRRLWRRILVSNPLFLFRVIQFRLSRPLLRQGEKWER